jgi:hypothetical protein
MRGKLMPKLNLAVDIADAAVDGDRSSKPLKVKSTARRLKDEHPEANASETEIADSLRATSVTQTA